MQTKEHNQSIQIQVANVSTIWGKGDNLQNTNRASAAAYEFETE